MAAALPLDREAMAERLARDIPEGWYVNLGLGLGLPTAVDPWIVNAGEKPVTLRADAALFHQVDSFAMRCVARVDTNLAVLDVTPGGLRVREMVPGLTLAQLQQQSGAPLEMAVAA